METPAKSKCFAGTATRLIAFVIDIVILNVTFGVIYLILKLTGYTYSEYWLIFIVLFLLYFGLQDSILFKGQTPGKRKMRIEVVDSSGKHLGTGISLARAFYISLIYFNFHFINVIYESLQHNLPEFLLVIVLTFLISFLILSTTIFMAFNPFYQGFHDAMLKSFVVFKDKFSPSQIESNFNVSRITAAYVLTFILTIICISITAIGKLIFF